MPDQFTHGYALLIGVGTTVDPRGSLPVTVKDAQALKAILTDPHFCAYPDTADQVRLLHDSGATCSAILAGLDWLKQKAAADPDATIIFYHSGHGMLDLSSMTYYLLPHNRIAQGDDGSGGDNSRLGYGGAIAGSFGRTSRWL